MKDSYVTHLSGVIRDGAIRNLQNAYLTYCFSYCTQHCLRLSYLLPEEDQSRSKRVATIKYTTYNSCAGRCWNASFIKPTQSYGKHRICSCLRYGSPNSSSWTPLLYSFIVGTDSFLRWTRGTKKRLKFRKVWQQTGWFGSPLARLRMEIYFLVSTKSS